MQLTNCHVHTFTADHVPAGYAGLPGRLARLPWLRRALLPVLRRLRPGARDRYERYARILEIAHRRTQAEVFLLLRSFYPRATRFVVLPMDMELMGAGRVRVPIARQHEELRELRDAHPDLVIPFAAVDPRRDDAVETAVRLIEEEGFRGVKLYPPLGYRPDDPALLPLYAYCEANGVPVMSHCSRGGAHYRGRPTARMLADPRAEAQLSDLRGAALAAHLADPDNYVPVLEAYPRLRLCLAHFGGAGDWERYLDDPWHAGSDLRTKSWLAKILDLIRSGAHEGLYTDISYTLYANEEYVHLLKVLLADERVRRRVLFGSDFYVVESAELEERRISVRLRALLGEETFRAIAEENPRRYLGELPA